MQSGSTFLSAIHILFFECRLRSVKAQNYRTAEMPKTAEKNGHSIVFVIVLIHQSHDVLRIPFTQVTFLEKKPPPFLFKWLW